MLEELTQRWQTETFGGIAEQILGLMRESAQYLGSIRLAKQYRLIGARIYFQY